MPESLSGARPVSGARTRAQCPAGHVVRSPLWFSALLLPRRARRGRIGKQCRERWFNHLDPAVSKEPWAVDEDTRLTTLVAQHGPRWKLVSQSMPGRSENSVKNRWNSAQRRKRVQGIDGAARAAKRQRSAGLDGPETGAAAAGAAAMPMPAPLAMDADLVGVLAGRRAATLAFTNHGAHTAGPHAALAGAAHPRADFPSQPPRLTAPGHAASQPHPGWRGDPPRRAGAAPGWEAGSLAPPLRHSASVRPPMPEGRLEPPPMSMPGTQQWPAFPAACTTSGTSHGGAWPPGTAPGHGHWRGMPPSHATAGAPYLAAPPSASAALYAPTLPSMAPPPPGSAGMATVPYMATQGQWGPGHPAMLAPQWQGQLAQPTGAGPYAEHQPYPNRAFFPQAPQNAGWGAGQQALRPRDDPARAEQAAGTEARGEHGEERSLRPPARFRLDRTPLGPRRDGGRTEAAAASARRESGPEGPAGAHPPHVHWEADRAPLSNGVGPPPPYGWQPAAQRTAPPQGEPQWIMTATGPQLLLPMPPAYAPHGGQPGMEGGPVYGSQQWHGPGAGQAAARGWAPPSASAGPAPGDVMGQGHRFSPPFMDPMAMAGRQAGEPAAARRMDGGSSPQPFRAPSGPNGRQHLEHAQTYIADQTGVMLTASVAHGVPQQGQRHPGAHDRPLATDGAPDGRSGADGADR